MTTAPPMREGEALRLAQNEIENLPDLNVTIVQSLAGLDSLYENGPEYDGQMLVGHGALPAVAYGGHIGRAGQWVTVGDFLSGEEFTDSGDDHEMGHDTALWVISSTRHGTLAAAEFFRNDGVLAVVGFGVAA